MENKVKTENKTEFSFLELLKAPFEALANVGIAAYNLFGGNASYFNLNPWVNLGIDILGIADITTHKADTKNTSMAKTKDTGYDAAKTVMMWEKIGEALGTELSDRFGLEKHNVDLVVEYADTNSNGKIDFLDSTAWATKSFDNKEGVRLDFGNELTLIFKAQAGKPSDVAGYVSSSLGDIRDTTKSAIMHMNTTL